jgi:hypothetical protein
VTELSLSGATGDGKNDRRIEKHILIVRIDGDVPDVTRVRTALKS